MYTNLGCGHLKWTMGVHVLFLPAMSEYYKEINGFGMSI